MTYVLFCELLALFPYHRDGSDSRFRFLPKLVDAPDGASDESSAAKDDGEKIDVVIHVDSRKRGFGGFSERRILHKKVPFVNIKRQRRQYELSADRVNVREDARKGGYARDGRSAV